VLNVWTRVVDGVARAMGVRNFCGVTVLSNRLYIRVKVVELDKR
jgi:hypothetical protein